MALLPDKSVSFILPDTKQLTITYDYTNMVFSLLPYVFVSPDLRVVLAFIMISNYVPSDLFDTLSLEDMILRLKSLLLYLYIL